MKLYTTLLPKYLDVVFQRSPERHSLRTKRINPFQANVPFLYLPLKTSENLCRTIYSRLPSKHLSLNVLSTLETLEKYKKYIQS